MAEQSSALTGRQITDFAVPYLAWIVVLTLGLAHGFSRFQPSPIAVKIISAASIASSILAATLAVWLIRPTPQKGRQKFTPGQVKVLILIIFGLGGFFIASGDLATLACWYTDLAGPRSSMVVTATGFSGGGRATCPSLDVSSASWLSGTRAFCGDRDLLSRIKPGTKITLTGDQSVLGMDVEYVDLEKYASGQK